MSYTLIDDDTGKDIIETLNSKEEEIERLQKLDKINVELIEKQDSELQRLYSIIKEIREYIEEHKHKKSDTLVETCENFIKEQESILEILDKE